MVTLRPDGSGIPYSLIGTAVDYRLRYYFGITPAADYVAAQGVYRLLADITGCTVFPNQSKLGFGPSGGSSSRGLIYLDENCCVTEVEADSLLAPLATSTIKWVAEFFSAHATTITDLDPVGRPLSREDEALLCRDCFVLALFENIYRVGRESSPLYALTAGDGCAEVHELNAGWVSDLVNLSVLFFESQTQLLSLPAILNPKFSGSRDVGGADADIILGSCLVEFKTTTDASLERKTLYQLLGYVLLDYDDQYGIDSIGVYFSRQGQFVHWPLAFVLETLTEGTTPSLDALRREFKAVLVGAGYSKATTN